MGFYSKIYVTTTEGIIVELDTVKGCYSDYALLFKPKDYTCTSKEDKLQCPINEARINLKQIEKHLKKRDLSTLDKWSTFQVNRVEQFIKETLEKLNRFNSTYSITADNSEATYYRAEGNTSPQNAVEEKWFLLKHLVEGQHNGKYEFDPNFH